MFKLLLAVSRLPGSKRWHIHFKKYKCAADQHVHSNWICYPQRVKKDMKTALLHGMIYGMLSGWLLMLFSCPGPVIPPLSPQEKMETHRGRICLINSFPIQVIVNLMSSPMDWSEKALSEKKPYLLTGDSCISNIQINVLADHRSTAHCHIFMHHKFHTAARSLTHLMGFISGRLGFETAFTNFSANWILEPKEECCAI